MTVQAVVRLEWRWNITVSFRFDALIINLRFSSTGTISLVCGGLNTSYHYYLTGIDERRDLQTGHLKVPHPVNMNRGPGGRMHCSFGAPPGGRNGGDVTFVSSGRRRSWMDARACS